jgi:hypothetical protein
MLVKAPIFHEKNGVDQEWWVLLQQPLFSHLIGHAPNGCDRLTDPIGIDDHAGREQAVSDDLPGQAIEPNHQQ